MRGGFRRYSGVPQSPDFPNAPGVALTRRVEPPKRPNRLEVLLLAFTGKHPSRSRVVSMMSGDYRNTRSAWHAVTARKRASTSKSMPMPGTVLLYAPDEGS
jgi:hypothetical protein